MIFTSFLNPGPEIILQVVTLYLADCHTDIKFYRHAYEVEGYNSYANLFKDAAGIVNLVVIEILSS